MWKKENFRLSHNPCEGQAPAVNIRVEMSSKCPWFSNKCLQRALRAEPREVITSPFGGLSVGATEGTEGSALAPSSYSRYGVPARLHFLVREVKGICSLLEGACCD